MTDTPESLQPEPPPPNSGTHLKRSHLILACILLPLLWLGRVLFTDHVLLPIPLLEQIAPWGQPREGGPWNPLMWDALAFFYPIRLAAAEAIRSGNLPLWNPFILSGTPLLADVQSAVLYPLNALFWLLPVERAFGYSAYLHLVLAGLFTAFWLRREEVSRTGALLGAVVFAVGGWSIAWLELPNFMATAVWLPLLLGFLAGTREGRWLLPAAGCALAVGMMLVAGHVQVAFYCLLGALLYALSLDIAERRFHRLKPLIIGGVLGVLLAAPQLLLARELSEISHRPAIATAETYAGFVGGAFPLAHLAGLLVPDFYGNPSDGLYLGRGQYSELTAYVGILPFLLGLYALFGLRRHRVIAVLAILVSVSLLLALGTPLNALFYFGVPGFARFGSPSRALILFAVAWSGLAGFGWDRLIRSGVFTPEWPGERDWKRVVALGGGLAVAFVLMAVLLFPAEARDALLLVTGAPALLKLIVLLVIAAALPWLGRRAPRWLAPAALGFVVLDLFLFGAGYNLTGPASALRPPAPFTEALGRAVTGGRIVSVNPSWPLHVPPTAVLPPNLSIPMGLLDVGGYEGAYLMSYKRQLNEWEGKDASPVTNGNMVMPTNLTSPMLRELAVQAVLTPEPLPHTVVEEAGLQYATGGDGWNLYTVLFPVHRAEFYPEWPAEGAGEPLEVEVSAANPNRVTIRLPEGHPAGYVLLRDATTEGWRVFVDGEPAEPIRAAVVERVVKVTSGAREVTWEYRSPALAMAWPLAIAGLIGTLALGSMGLMKRRSRSME